MNFESDWEKELKEAVEGMISSGWKICIKPYYIQGEETLTLKKNERYLYIAYGDFEDLKSVLKEIDDP